MVRCLVFNPAKPMNEISVEDVSDFGHFLRDHNPGCFCIGCATRYFNGVAHDVWHDDEFLFNGGAPSGIVKDDMSPFLGCVFICNVDEDTGESTGLSDEDISGILSTIGWIRDGKGALRKVFTCRYYPEEESE